ncbi:hypothetical protein [Streptomyces xanthophaeus]|uniref:hypothetical protein n=1 Tax=Streptomyces xanthophaeus TaxID=67385 RepID=UPI002647D016|nr:hypothetical protein [Streptomyces xanthophaeus]WKD30805.1 hypothetical protein KO717_01695 [Streptomyces xanthophaeus]
MPRSRRPGRVRLRRSLLALALLAPALLGAAPDGSGETISLTGNGPGLRLDVTLTQVVDPASPAGPESTGTDRLVATRFRLENTGTAVYQDSPAPAAHLLDTAGQRFTGDDVPTTAGPAFPETVTLDPGGTAEGFVAFRIPADAEPAAVQFALDTGLADDVGQWSLPLP